MKVLALRNKNAARSPIGATVAGEIYSVPDELSKDDLTILLGIGAVELVDVEPEADAEPAGLTTDGAAPLVGKRMAGKAKK